MNFHRAHSYASAVLGVVILSVRLSLCLSHVCFVTNPKNLPTIFLYHMKGQSFYFSDAKDLGEIPKGQPSTGAPNSGVIGQNGDFRPISGYMSQTVQNRDIVTMEC